MSRKDYIMIAAILNSISKSMDPKVFDLTVVKFCEMFKADNPAFDHVRFIRACNL
jgi:hypothetical protein